MILMWNTKNQVFADETVLSIEKSWSKNIAKKLVESKIQLQRCKVALSVMLPGAASQQVNTISISYLEHWRFGGKQFTQNKIDILVKWTLWR
jgi:hypothetical protein